MAAPVECASPGDRDGHRGGRGETKGFRAEELGGGGGRLAREAEPDEGRRVEARERGSEARFERRGVVARVELEVDHRPDRDLPELPGRGAAPAIPLEREEERPLRFVPLGEGGPVRRAGEEDGGGEGAPGEVADENLRAVDVPREDGREARRDVPAANDVGPVAKGVVDRPDLRPFDGLVEAQEADVGLDVRVARRREESGEARSHIGREREAGECEVESFPPDDERSGAVEDADPRMCQEEFARHPGTLVVPGDPEDVQPQVGELREAREDSLREPGRNPAPVEEIAAVDDDAGLAAHRRRERPLEALEEVVPAAAPLDPWPRREVEAEMGVGEEEDPDRHRARGYRRCPARGAARVRISLGFSRKRNEVLVSRTGKWNRSVASGGRREIDIPVLADPVPHPDRGASAAVPRRWPWLPDFRVLWDRVLHEHASPARVGLAVGVGVLVGCSPFLGLQVAIAALLAIAFRLNKLAVFLGLQISAPPLTPLVLFVGAQLGELIRHGSFLPMNLGAFRAMPTTELVHLLFFDLLAGGTLLGLVLGTTLGMAAARMAGRRASPEFHLSRDEMAYLGVRLRALPFGLRQYVRWKIVLDPVYAVVASRLKGVRETLDLGAGLGIMAAVLVHRDPERHVVAVEWDSRKAAGARQLLSGLKQIEVVCTDARQLPIAPVESILLLDVLHYGEPAAQDTWLGRCASALKPGGLLIVREHDATPRGTLAEWTEGLTVRIGWNRGHGFHPRKTIDLVRRLESLGLEVETISNGAAMAGLNLLVAHKAIAAEPPQAARPTSD